MTKSAYVFSVDEENGKVAHVNFLPKEVLERKVLDAKSWLAEVSKILGGKVGVASFQRSFILIDLGSTSHCL